MQPDSSAEAAASTVAAPATWSRNTAHLLIGLAAFAAAAAYLYWFGLASAAAAWERPEYSYGYLVPFIATYLLWRRLPSALAIAPDRRWLGIALAVVAVLLGIIGALSRIADLSTYGFILALAAGSIAVLGFRASLRLWAPIVYLAFMLPLPQVIYLKLSAGMQLLSSEFGVALVRLVGIPVLLEGNVIDLGNYKLQVAEACSGLRYLFPLMGFGFLFAILYKGPTWQKWTLFLSTVPITIVMNSVRIGVIGVLVTYYGTEQAEGFLHAFEGWIIFIACIALLFAETALLARLTRNRRPLRDMLDVQPGPRPNFTPVANDRGWMRPLGATVGLLIAGVVALGASTMGNEASAVAAEAAVPPRQDLVGFPATVQEWSGQQGALPTDVLRVLAPDDYLVATYERAGEPEVSLFVAYYLTQTDGRAVHSPQVCLPGDGWETRSFEAITVHTAAGTPMQVNRALIQKGLSRALVYYWFEGRGRRVTDEYVAKWYILWDGITRRRTDGALVRLVTTLPAEGGEELADDRLMRFLGAVEPKLATYIPH